MGGSQKMARLAIDIVLGDLVQKLLDPFIINLVLKKMPQLAPIRLKSTDTDMRRGREGYFISVGIIPNK